MTAPKTSLLTPLAITMGDGAGIGPEIIAKSFQTQPVDLQACFVVGDVAHMQRASQLVATKGQKALRIAQIDRPSDAVLAPPGCIPVLQPQPGPGLATWGQISASAGAFAGACVLWAARSVLRGDACAVVTAPLHKEALFAAGPPYSRFPGHTELLQEEAARYCNKAVAEMPVRMMLANAELRTVLVSIHMSLRDALDAVTFENITKTLEITHHALTGLLGRVPRIAVAGLNPHAGEGGLFGREEIAVIHPAIVWACKQGWDVKGPFAPDTIFMRARQKAGQQSEFDVVVAMYHDQGLIPVKYLGVEDGVNMTLGLPFVRTSPDHGTAFDIAGTGCANPQSLLQAIRAARAWPGL